MNDLGEKQIASKDDSSCTRKNDKKKLATVVLTFVLTLAVLFVYRLFLVPDTPIYRYYPYVMWGYMIILTVLVIVYIVYNRGFSRNGLTPEMLPADWNDEKKREFIDSAVRRKSGSKWMLIFIIAFVVTFLVDAIEIFVIPFVSGLFK